MTSANYHEASSNSVVIPFNLTFAQRLCIAIKVGIQNALLAIAITARLLNHPDLAVPAAAYSL